MLKKELTQFLPQIAEIFWGYEEGCSPPLNGGDAEAEGVDASIVTDE